MRLSARTMRLSVRGLLRLPPQARYAYPPNNAEKFLKGRGETFFKKLPHRHKPPERASSNGGAGGGTPVGADYAPAGAGAFAPAVAGGRIMRHFFSNVEKNCRQRHLLANDV